MAGEEENGMNRTFLYSEAKLAEMTGLSRTDLVKFRKEKLAKGKDWRKSKKGKGGTIELSQGAVDKIVQTFGINDANADGARVDAAILMTIPNLETIQTDFGQVRIIKTPLMDAQFPILRVCFLPINKRTLRAKDEREEMFWVIVPNNEVFAIGDPLRAKVSRHDGYLELVGTPPRWRSDKLYRQEFK